MPLPPLDITLLRAAFPGWLIIQDGQAWRAMRRQAGVMAGYLDRFAAVGQPRLAASTPADLAVQLSALEYSLGITPTS